jgi:serine/threonine protein phosphatase PrpC
VTVEVRCSHCKSACGVEPALVGAAVRCGQCGNVFQANAIPGSSSPTGSAPAPKRAGVGGRFWQGVKGVVGSLTAARPLPATGMADVELAFDGLPATGSPRAAATNPGRLEIGAATSVGRVRERNEDCYLVQHWSWSQFNQRQEHALLAVADGMGGFEGGDRAAAEALREIAVALVPHLLALHGGKPQAASAWPAALTAALKSANAAVLREAQANPTLAGMGATAVVALVVNDQVQIAHVGDCRAYRASAGQLQQVTRDHTLVARMVELGKLTPQEALVHPQRNEITQALGRPAELQPGLYQCGLQPGDWLLLACDGLQARLENDAIEAAVATAGNARELAQHLVDLADEAGGSDNCTVVAVRATPFAG